MAESLRPTWLVTLGEYLQEESEKQWFWFSVFIAIMLVGVIWIEASLHLPGVEQNAILDEGEMIGEVAWDSDGTNALFLVERTDGSPLRHLDNSELTTVDTDGIVVRGFTSTSAGWLIVGDNGSISLYNGMNLHPLSLDWVDNRTLDIMAVASNNGENGFLITKENSVTRLHTFSDGDVSAGTEAPVESTVMVDVHLSEDDSMAIIIGYDTALGNPTFGPAGEVVMRADAVLGQAPSLTLLHHGAGGAIHSAIFVDDNAWGDDVEMLLASGTSTMLLMSDSTIIDLPQVSGSTAAAIDSEGVFWFARGNSGQLLSIEPMGEVMQYKVSQSFVVDATVGTSTADEVHFFGTGVDGNVGVMSFSPTADEDVSQSLARFGDLLFLIIVFFCISIIIQLFYVNELKPW